MKVYFAHPVTDYGTAFEAEAVEIIEAEVGPVLNPNAPEHDAGYRAQGMAYFDRLIESCDAVVYLRMPRSVFVGAGVAREVDSFDRRGLPIYEIERDGRLTFWTRFLAPRLSVEATRAALAVERKRRGEA